MIHDQPWAADAACTDDTALFYATFGEDDAVIGEDEDVDAALEICEDCPVREECLLYALEHDVAFGVWGGTTPTEREAVRKAAKELSD